MNVGSVYMGTSKNFSFERFSLNLICDVLIKPLFNNDLIKTRRASLKTVPEFLEMPIYHVEYLIPLLSTLFKEFLHFFASLAADSGSRPITWPLGDSCAAA